MPRRVPSRHGMKSSILYLHSPKVWPKYIVRLSEDPLIQDSLSGAGHWWLTGVYGPQDNKAKLDFIADLHDVRESRIGPWLLGGDFNMITSAVGRSREVRWL